MNSQPPSADPGPIGAYRFGVFELDVREGELRKQGRLIHLRGQPLQILLALIARPGLVVTREELRQRLWPDDTFVEFDHSLNTAIKRLRETLGDTASTPRFVETVPRKGYRFTAPVEPIGAEPIRAEAIGGGSLASADANVAATSAASLGAQPLAPVHAGRALDAGPRGGEGRQAGAGHGAHAEHGAAAERPGGAGHQAAAVHPSVAHTHDADVGASARSPRGPRARLGGVAIAAATLVIVVAAGSVLMFRGTAETGAAVRIEAASPRVAVLPFQNLSGDDQREHVAAGFTEELISQLGRLAPGRLGVIARSSSSTFASASSSASSTSPSPSSPPPAPSPSLQEIARSLDADYVIEGSVRAQGDRYRVAVRLVRTRDVTAIWSDLYEGALLDLMTMQRDVGEQVSRHLAVAVLPADRAALARATTSDSRAYEEYLRGVSELARGPIDGFARAQTAFEQAIARDPGYALAYAGLAETHIRQQDYYIIAPARAQQAARPAAAKALAIDDSLAEAHCALADVFSRGEGQAAGAEQSFARAIALNPSRAETHLRYSSHLQRIGRRAEARARLTVARQLAPRSADIITEAAWMEMDDGRLDAAAALASEALRYQPDFPFARYVLGQLALRRSDTKEAVTQFEQARITSGQAPKYLAALATAYLADGRHADAERMLEGLRAQSRDRYVPPGTIETLTESLRASSAERAASGSP